MTGTGVLSLAGCAKKGKIRLFATATGGQASNDVGSLVAHGPEPKIARHESCRSQSVSTYATAIFSKTKANIEDNFEGKRT